MKLPVFCNVWPEVLPPPKIQSSPPGWLRSFSRGFLLTFHLPLVSCQRGHTQVSRNYQTRCIPYDRYKWRYVTPLEMDLYMGNWCYFIFHSCKWSSFTKHLPNWLVVLGGPLCTPPQRPGNQSDRCEGLPSCYAHMQVPCVDLRHVTKNVKLKVVCIISRISYGPW